MSEATSLFLTATIIEVDMATALISENSTASQTSNEFINAPGNRFTISGHSKKSSNWCVNLEKKFSDGNWYLVRTFNATTPIATFMDGGTFRIVKPEGFTCLVDKD